MHAVMFRYTVEMYTNMTRGNRKDSDIDITSNGGKTSAKLLQYI